MTDLLLQVFYLIRPLMFAYIDVGYFGLNLFELMTGAMLAILFAAYLMSGRSPLRGFDRLDTAMAIFAAWCLLVTLIQWDLSDWKATAKWALPFAMFLLLRRMVRSERDYMRCLKWLLLGFVAIVAANAFAIWKGVGFTGINWYTGIERYRGVFQGVHTMAHTMAFSVMLATVYFSLLHTWGGRAAWRQQKVLASMCGIMVLLALYCIVKGNVRTVMTGLVIFFGVWLWLVNRKYLMVYVASLAAFWIVSPVIQLIFWDVTSGVGVGTPGEMAASGRPFIWKHNLSMFADLPLHQKLMGLGVGNEIGILPSGGLITYEYRTRAWESHNDFLSALMELGLIGFLLVLWIFVAIFQSIRRIQGAAQMPFMAMFVAVVAMNFLSNSYLNRFGLGQLFLMVMAGIDVARHARVERMGIPRMPRAFDATYIAGNSGNPQR